MTAAYSLLQEGLLPREAPNDPDLPLDGKRAQTWAEALPRANQAVTLRMLMEVLEKLSQSILEGGARLAVLEAIRPAVLEIMQTLKQQAQGGTVPLVAAKARAIDQLTYFEMALAEGYRLAVIEHCAPAGSVPFLRGGAVATALVRASYHAAKTFTHAYNIYQSPPSGRWTLLHRLYLFARSVKLQEKAVEDSCEPKPMTVEELYTQASLLALSNPYRFSQKEQEELWRVTADLASHLSVSDSRGGGQVFALPTDSDSGPGFVPEERAQESGSLLWLDLMPLRDLLEIPLSGNASGPVLLRGRGGRSVASTVELLRKLRGGWGTSATRRNQRLPATHQLRAVIGLAGLHFHLSGKHDFEGFLQQAGAKDSQQDRRRATWAQSGIDSGRIPLHLTEVLDQSLGGYRVRWPTEESVRARVGELLGLTDEAVDEQTPWMLACIRWLRYDPDGTVYAGLELLARRTRAVAVKVRDRDSLQAGAPRPQRAVQFMPVRDDSHGSLHLALGSGVEVDDLEAELVRASESRDLEVPEALRETLNHLRVLEVSGEYVIARAEREAA
ncbi:MAG: hypothetical protein KDJ14_09180 [Xanthomonadales bacterium]|nr:hypothetical protein [Xanthomonadales bacterium]